MSSLWLFVFEGAFLRRFSLVTTDGRILLQTSVLDDNPICPESINASR